MRPDLTPLLNHLPPKTLQALTRAIHVCGRELGIAPDWIQRWIAFTVVADALVRDTPHGAPAFHLKGGAAIELRLRQLRPASGATSGQMQQPRATKDLDATFLGDWQDLDAAIRAALATPRHAFAFRVEVETTEASHMRRFGIHISYREARYGRVVEKPFCNVPLEVSAYEGERRTPDMVAAFSLAPFGFVGPDALPCLPLPKQIAQKLHAVTETPPMGKKNDRFRDLLDIVLLSAMVPASPVLREICEETFTLRQRHGWPPEVVLHPHWREPLEARARDMQLDPHTADDIVAYVGRYIHDITTVA